MAFKISFKIGGRVKLEHSEVLPVTLAIYDRQGQIQELVSYLYPLPTSLEKKFKEWQNHIGIQGDRKVIRNSKTFPKVVNLKDLTNSLKTELNQWLGQYGWIDEKGEFDPRVSLVLSRFREKITDKDEVQIIVQTEDRQLRGLPWQEWETLASYTSRGVEVAISATNFQRLTQKSGAQLKATVRILVVFGDAKLDFKEEDRVIKNLMRRYGGEPRTLKEPTRQELEDELKDPQGWHIFFFAGHSESDEDGRIGWIQINTKEGGIIAITELRELLKGAIEKKLQLAIFNSCDGLGLANQLTELSLPYCIAMREPVESEVARELLKHFLAAFVKDRPLFASMNVARQQLKERFAPGKSWLPVIVANPLAQELTWNRLFSERRLSWQWEMVLGMTAIAILVSLPIGILTEFQGWKALTLYAQLYPHMTVYPSLFLWISLFASYRAHCMIRMKTRQFVIFTLVTIFISSGALFFELNGDRMMLMELNSNAMTTISAEKLPEIFSKWKTSQKDIISIPQEIFDGHKAFDVKGNLTLRKSELESVIERLQGVNFNEIGKIQGLLRIATSYDVWRSNHQSFSISRWFYALNFIAIVTCGVQILALVSTIMFVPDSIFNKNKYLTYLIICELGILLWLPFEGYSIVHTKNLLFSQNFRGDLAGINPIIYPIISILFWTTISSIYRSATQKYQPILLSFLLGSLGLTLLSSFFGVSLIDRLFGMSSTDPLTPWFASIIFFAPLFLQFVRWIDLQIGDE